MQQEEYKDVHFMKKHIYDVYDFQYENIVFEKESKEYQACYFDLNGMKIHSRSSKITPTKVGQFVTFWKRIGKSSIQPFENTEDIDFLIVFVRNGENFGHFVFSQSVLIEKGILKSSSQEGKRGFRIYAPWDVVESKQAKKSQKWQIEYFLKMDFENGIDEKRLRLLYTKNK